MFLINDDDMSIYITRGDTALFQVSAMKSETERYVFKVGDVVRIKVFEKKACENVVLQKDFGIEEETDIVTIYLDERDTKIGEVISKPKDYWYEVELNPFTDPQTIVGYDDDGAKVFKLFPEGADVPDIEIPEEVLEYVDKELSLTSTKPVENQAVSRAVFTIQADLRKTTNECDALGDALDFERTRIDQILNPHGSSENAIRSEFVMLDDGNTKIKAISNGLYVVVDVNATVGAEMGLNVVKTISPDMKLFKPTHEYGFVERKVFSNAEVSLQYQIGAINDTLRIDVGNTTQSTITVNCQFIYAVDKSTLSIPEINDARIGHDGTVYNTLGEAIRQQIGGALAEEWRATVKRTQENKVIFEGDIKLYSSGNFKSNDTIYEGQLYSVRWNGERYSCRGRLDDEGFVRIGNDAIEGVEGVEDTGEPFLISSTSGGTQLMVRKVFEGTDIPMTRLIIETIQEIEYNKMPKEFLPDDIEIGWDKVKDKPFYEKTTTAEVVNGTYDAELMVEGEPRQIILGETDAIGMVEGDKLTVVFDDTEYTLEVKCFVSETDNSETMLYAGNLYLWDTNCEDTGELFLICDGHTIYTSPTEETHYVRIVTVHTEIKELDEKFIPEVTDMRVGYDGRIYPTAGEALRTQLAEAMNEEWRATAIKKGEDKLLHMARYQFGDSTNIKIPYTIKEDWLYSIYWNYKEYLCRGRVCNDGLSMCLGNDAIAGIEGAEDTGEPFWISTTGNSYFQVKKASENVETISIQISSVQEIEYNKMPKEFLPDNIGGANVDVVAEVGQMIVVKEVDDNGKPTKWEAVNVPTGGASHWDDIEGKPFYAEGGETVLFDGEIHVLVEQGGQAMLNYFVLEEGKKYKVDLDGVSYECEGKAMLLDEGEPPVYFIGNGKLFELEDTGEPFMIMSGENTETGETLCLLGYYPMMMGEITEDVVLSCKISYNREIIHKLDNKFIDAEWMATTKEEAVSVLEETTLELKTTKTTYFVNNDTPFKAGTKYLVTWDGEGYECICKMVTEGENSLWYLGFYGETNTEYPFRINYSPLLEGSYSVVIQEEPSEARTITLKIEEIMNAPVPIPKDFLPKGYGYLGEKGKEETIFEQEVAFEDDEGAGFGGTESPINFVEGDSYILELGETKYECICKSLTQTIDGITGTASWIGNAGIMGMENTGEPFLIVTQPMGEDENGNFMYGTIMATEVFLGANVPVKITHIAGTPTVQFDPALIPNKSITLYFGSSEKDTELNKWCAYLYHDKELTKKVKVTELMQMIGTNIIAEQEYDGFSLRASINPVVAIGNASAVGYGEYHSIIDDSITMLVTEEFEIT